MRRDVTVAKVEAEQIDIRLRQVIETVRGMTACSTG